MFLVPPRLFPSAISPDWHVSDAVVTKARQQIGFTTTVRPHIIQQEVWGDGSSEACIIGELRNQWWPSAFTCCVFDGAYKPSTREMMCDHRSDALAYAGFGFTGYSPLDQTRTGPLKFYDTWLAPSPDWRLHCPSVTGRWNLGALTLSRFLPFTWPFFPRA